MSKTYVTFEVDILDFMASQAPKFENISSADVVEVYSRYKLGNIYAKNHSQPSIENFEITKALLRYEWAVRMIKARKIFLSLNQSDF